MVQLAAFYTNDQAGQASVYSKGKLRGFRIFSHRFAALCLLSAALALLLILSAGETDSEDDSISLERLSTFISLATSYLVRISHTAEQEPDYPGRFMYIAYLGEELQTDGFDEKPQEEYNLLRHNGAIYSLGLSYERTPSEEVKDAMQRGIHYLKNHAIAAVPDVEAGDGSDLPGLLAAWEYPDEYDDDETEKANAKAKLGGAGLALISMCALERISPGTTKLEYMRQVGHFIAFLQNEDGSFTCRYSVKHGRDNSWVSLYYPGEAALGLVQLALLETDDGLKKKWLNVATKTLMYLEDLRRVQELEDIEPDHWALLATAKLLPLLNDTTIEYWRVYNHAVRVIQSMLADHTAADLIKSKGCFTDDRRTCPTATRLEGLIAGLTFVRDSEIFIGLEENLAIPLRERMKTDIRLGIEFMLDSQQTSDRYNMQGAVPVKYPTHPKKDDREVRVDYVQHSMSAVIAYEALLLSEQKSFLDSMALPDLTSNQMASIGIFLLTLASAARLVFRKRKKLAKHSE